MAEAHSIIWLTFVVHLFTTSFLLFLGIFHGSRVYSDLFTTTRNSVKFRSSMPTIHTLYKCVTWATFMAVCFYCLGQFFSALLYMVTTDIECFMIFSLQATAFFVAKLITFLIFLLRLKIIFGGSSFAYSECCLWSTGVFFTVFITLQLCLIVYGVLDISSVLFDDGPSVPNDCVFDQTPIVIISFGLYFIHDFFFSIGFMIAFVVPLKKTLAMVNQNQSRMSGNASAVIVNLRLKTTILTTVALTSSMIALLVAFLTDLSYLLFAADIIISSICLMLMTPYYDDDIYYRKICFAFVYCCHRRTATTSDENQIRMDLETASKNYSNTLPPVSVSTTEQPPVATSTATPPDSSQTSA